MDISEFRPLSCFSFDAIILYDVVTESGATKALQLYAGRKELNADALFDKRYSIFQDGDDGAFLSLDF